MTVHAEPRVLLAGDCAVPVELADEISPEANARVLTLERLAGEARAPGVIESAPTVRALLVRCDPLLLPWARTRFAGTRPASYRGSGLGPGPGPELSFRTRRGVGQ